MSNTTAANPWDDPGEESSASNQPNEEKKPDGIPSTPFPLPPAGFDEFDPVNLRLDQSYLQQPAAQKILTEVPIRKPGNVDFFPCSPGFKLLD